MQTLKSPSVLTFIGGAVAVVIAQFVLKSNVELTMGGVAAMLWALKSPSAMVETVKQRLSSAPPAPMPTIISAEPALVEIELDPADRPTKREPRQS